MAKKLWGGRFTKEIDKEFFEFQKSISYDHKLAAYDVLHSLIHVIALGKANILGKTEKNKLQKALNEILKDIDKGKFKFNKESEDIHTDIQNKVEKKIGKLALKLHTLRSRNDQIVFDEKSYCHVQSAAINNLLSGLLDSLLFLKKKYGKYSIVGYTHTQRAQKVSFKNYIDTYYRMFSRDKNRITFFWKNVKIYIGAGALAGSSIKKEEYEKAIKELMKSKKAIKPSINTLDDVSDRDFVIELLGILAIIQMHLSRMAEDLILYSTQEFNFVKLPEEFCTGSSLMPHKKNPDFLELVRGYTGRVYGNLVSILTTMKGLPLTYNRDMQTDKEPLFSSVELVKSEISIMIKLLKGVNLNVERINEILTDENLYATTYADNLVRKYKIPFRKAHEIVGKAIKSGESLEEKLAKREIGEKVSFKESLAGRIAKLKRE